MSYSTTAKNTMLDSLVPDLMKVHTADPGSAGTLNTIGTTENCAYNAASSEERVLNADVNFTGNAATITHHSIWDGAVFLYAKPFAVGQLVAAGDTITVKATLTKMTAGDL